MLKKVNMTVTKKTFLDSCELAWQLREQALEFTVRHWSYEPPVAPDPLKCGYSGLKCTVSVKNTTDLKT